MDREQRLLEIVRAQTDIAAARLEPSAVLEAVAERARAITGADAAAVELVDGSDLVTACAIGSTSAAAGGRAPRAGSLSGLAVGQGRVVRCDDAAGDDRVDAAACAREGVGSAVCAPLVHHRRTVGVLRVWATAAGRFGAADEETLTLLSGVAAAHLSNAEEHARSLARTLEDEQTGLGNLRAYRQRLALELGRRDREGGTLAVIAARVACPAGDDTPRTAAAVLRRWTRSIDGVHRIAADLYTLILPGADDAAARALAARVGAQLADALPPQVGIGFGVAEASGGDPDALHAAALSDLAAAGERARAA